MASNKMPARNSDGTIRNARAPKKLTERSVRARWIEAEVVRLKRFGLPFISIAEQITQVGRGQAQALIALPPDLTFPPNYRIGTTGVRKAYLQAINREPSLEVHELRRLFNDRYEDQYFRLQPKISKGDVQSILAGARITDLSAKLNGAIAPQCVELTGKDGKTILPIEALTELIEQADREDAAKKVR